MLLISRIKLPLLKKSSHKAKPKPNKRLRRSSCKQLPSEIQEIICSMVLGNDASNPFALTAMRVCKTWASFICERMYKQFQFKNYIQFIGFINTIALKNPVLPYNLYVRHIDLTPVNKYGVDIRVRRLIKYCPNLSSIQLGQATSVKADTLQLMGKYCYNVQTLEMGGLQSFPFMFDCDFSGMLSLESLSLSTTPLQSASLNTIPRSISQLQISQMDALEHDEFARFLKHHQQLVSLSVRRCKHLNKDFATLIGHLPILDVLELSGPEIDDEGLKEMFNIPTQLKTLRLCHTQISDTTLEAIAAGCLVIQHLDIAQNTNVTQYGINSLLRKKQFQQLTY
ncbi:unnamed protein product [Mucor circinelloides]|uniref:F-box/LRR-repeat protein 15-like leucin rich repeat domain-containing protein n=1 Tax=Mucor circinelloides f. circinelloides (strain 1006PhL) TaxID=1220926 RepID=S2KDA9_MUCC1|nr:hypothetical protein HMPREF1544_02850 [Mucor circinelloides 1006PhL]